jgi:lipopolysaccharide biosynthesis glycosyltransferase
MAIASAKSVKQHCKGIAVHIFTDQPEINSKWVDSSTPIANPHVRSKVDYISQTPFDETLFLDADTKVVTDITEVFDLLKAFDMAMAHAQKRNHFPTLQNWREKIPASFPQMNSGVVLFRKNEQTIKVLKDWKTAYHNNGFWKDQVTLREIIWKSPLRIGILPPEYNVRFEKYLKVWEEEEAIPKILHFASFKADFNADYSESRGKIQTRKQRMAEKWAKLKWLLKELRSLV